MFLFFVERNGSKSALKMKKKNFEITHRWHYYHDQGWLFSHETEYIYLFFRNWIIFDIFIIYSSGKNWASKIKNLKIKNQYLCINNRTKLTVLTVLTVRAGQNRWHNITERRNNLYGNENYFSILSNLKSKPLALRQGREK